MPASWQACSMVVGTGLPCQSAIILGTSISRPSAFILMVASAAAGAGSAGLDGLGATVDMISVAGFDRQTRRLARRLRQAGFYLVGCAFRLELVFELVDETEHRPGAGFTEGANGPALNVGGDLSEII